MDGTAVIVNSTTSQIYPLNVVLVGSDEAELVAVQRNLSNAFAYVEGHYVDLGEAMSINAGEQQRVFIVMLSSSNDIVSLRRLTSSLAGQPFLVVVPADTSREEVFSVMRAGAMQVVTMPIDDADFKEALDWFAIHFGYESKSTQVIAIAGVSGGCGSTTLAANIAYELALQQGTNCILTEMGRSMGAVASHFDVTPKCTTRDVFAKLDVCDLYILRNSLTRVMDHLDILPGSVEANDPATVSLEQVRQLVAWLRRLAEVVFVDVPCEFNDLYFETLATANQVVLVCTQSLASIRNARMIRESLARQFDVHPGMFVVNKYNPLEKPFLEEDMAKFLGVPKVYVVPRDSAIKTAGDMGRPLRRESSRSPALISFDAIVRELLHIKTAPDTSNLFRRVWRACGLT